MTQRLLAVRILLIALCFTLSFNACSSKPARKESRCAGVDWWEMGRTDGVAGLTLEKGLHGHTSLCKDSGFPVAKDLYENGRDAGLIDYCAPQQGLAAGHAGAKYEGVCPAYLETPFLAQYKVGQRLYELEVEDSELESRIDNLVELLNELVAKANSGTALKAQIEDLRQRRQNLDLEMTRLETTNTASGTSPDPTRAPSANF